MQTTHEKIRTYLRQKQDEVDYLNYEIYETRRVLMRGDSPTWRRVELEKVVETKETQALLLTKIIAEVSSVLAEDVG